MPAKLIYDRATLRADAAELARRLPVATLFYAAKACAEKPVLSELAALGLGYEVAGMEEMHVALDIGVDPGRIICGLPMKGPELIARMYAAGCRSFVFDCPEEFASLRRHAPDAQYLLRIGIQDLDSGSIAWGMAHGAVKTWIADFPEVLRSIHGVTFHVTRNYRPVLLGRVVDRAEAVLLRLAGDVVPILNIGGGYRTTLPAHLALKFDLDRFYAELTDRLAALQARRPVRLWAEPGRALVERAGRLQTSVLQVRADAQTHVIVLELNIGTKPGAHPSEIAAVAANGARCCIRPIYIFRTLPRREE